MVKQSVDSIYLTALQEPSPEERSAYLDQVCGNNVELRQRVERLLRAEPDVGSFLESPAQELGGAPDQVSIEKPGSEIGPYTLIEQIGEGGFGVVYLAEQDRPIRRTVALKIIKPGMDTKQVIARFKAERQALALMNHANIAKVLDAGATDSGRPYFIMELVKGLPVTEYCDKCNLTVLERLKLFVSICRAVQHAHQKGIIHRDIKPTNVLVAIQDGQPTAKIIDFGVAKAINQTLTEQTVRTAFAQMLGTPLYMSPEQAEMSPLDVDTRTDIYSLGVLLYELLTGTTPFEKGRLSDASFDELRRIIREEAPPRPSTRISTLAADVASTIAERRHTDPRRIAQQVRGELDWIVMKALEKDRSRRYESASTFAADVKRYLNDETVHACPPSVGYRLRKFAQRNKGPVLAASLISVLLVGGTIGTTLGMIRAMSAEQLARERLGEVQQANAETADALSKSEEAREEAEAVGQFLVAAFRKPDPSLDGRQLKVVDMLDDAVTELDTEFTGSLRIKEKLLAALGRTYTAVGVPSKAIDLLERARALREARIGPEHPDTVTVMHDLGTAYCEAGHPKLALPILEQTVRLSKAQLGIEEVPTLISMHNLAETYRAIGKLRSAISLHEQTLALAKTHLGAEHRNTLMSMGSLASAYQAAGMWHQALPLLEQTLALRKAHLGPDHPDTIQSMANLATMYHDAGKHNQALALFEQAVTLATDTLGPEHPNTLIAMSNLGEAYRVDGKLEQALPLLERSLPLQKAKLGVDALDTLQTMNKLAMAYKDAGRLDVALPLAVETMTRMKTQLGPRHGDTLSAMNNLVTLYVSVRQLDQALPLARQTLGLRKDMLGLEHPDTLTSMNNLGHAYWVAGKLEQSLPLFEQTLTLRKKTLGPEHSKTLTSMHNLAVALRDAGRLREALPIFEQTLKLRTTKLGPEHPATLSSMHILGRALQAAGSFDQALPLLEQTLALYRSVLGVEDRRTLALMTNLASAYQDARKPDQALPLFRQTLEVRMAKLGPEHRDTLRSMNNLGRAYWGVKRLDQALPLFKQALALQMKVLGAEDEETLLSMNNLASAYRDAEELDLALPLFRDAVDGARKSLRPGHPYMSVFVGNLADLHERLAQPAMAEPLRRELVEFAKQQQGVDSLQHARRLGQLGFNLIEQESYAEAEPLLWNCLAIREKKLPYDGRTFQTRVMLGSSLLGQGKYAEAESQLLHGYEEMKQHQGKIPTPHLSEALEQLVQLYGAWGKQTEAAAWKDELEAHKRNSKASLQKKNTQE